MDVDRHSREHSLDLAAGSFSLDTVGTGIAAGKDLYAVTVDLIATHDLLLDVGRIGLGYGSLRVLRSQLHGLVVLLFFFLFLGCSSVASLV